MSGSTELNADVHYYPGQPLLRAAIGERRSAPEACRRPDGASDIAGLLTDWAAALEEDPWLTVWPALLAGTALLTGQAWHLADSSGAAVPLLGQESLWTLLAVSGGSPVTVAGEWRPDGFLPLTVWHEDTAVRL